MNSTRLKSLLVPVGGALLLSGVAGAVYYYLKNNDEEDDVSGGGGGGGGGGRVKEVWTSALIDVPVEAIGLVIGRQGTNIKLIQQSTNTRIKFSDEEKDSKRRCIILGTAENIRLARQLIMKVVEEQPIVETSEIRVPQIAISRIIGRNGSTVRSISHSTGAKVMISKEDDFSSSSAEELRRIVIKGTKDQIEAAKIQLLEKVAEAEEYREMINASASKMSLRSRGRQPTQTNDTNQSALLSGVSVHEDALSSLGSDKFIEAYVSAVDSATHFWIQVVSPRAIELDKLLTEMTEYYNDEESKELHQLDEVHIDSIVAAKFPRDDYWYRGKVRHFVQSEEDPQRSQVTVYYVDFGDTETIALDSVCELRTDFLRLSFQAVECYLANIDPESARSEEAADVFEELTYASQWKSVTVQVLGYKQNTDTDTTSAIAPYVQIIDTSGPVDVDVAQELVRRDLASFCKDSSHSQTSNVMK